MNRARASARDIARGDLQAFGRGKSPPPAAEHERALECIAKLTHVSGPRVPFQELEVLSVDRTGIDTTTFVQVTDQAGQVVDAVAKRWNTDVHDRDAVEKIEA